VSEWFTPQRITWLHRANPAWKGLLLFLVMLVLFFCRDLAFITVMACLYGGLLFIFSGFACRKLLLFCLPFALTFLSSSLTLALFGKGEHVLWQWGIVKISEESVRSGLIIGMKSLAIGMISLVLLLTTRPGLLFYALMQQFRFPAKYAYSFLAAVRLVPIVIEEWQTRTHALKARGIAFSKGVKGVYERLKLYSVPLFAQSIRRAQRMAIAMEAKQFRMNGPRTYYYETSYSQIDAYLTAYVCGSLLVALLAL
jgi:ABC-type cobalt transport system, permease component CbiQ and related transporters